MIRAIGVVLAQLLPERAAQRLALWGYGNRPPMRLGDPLPADRELGGDDLDVDEAIVAQRRERHGAPNGVGEH
jgi:hypothetical protein